MTAWWEGYIYGLLTPTVLRVAFFGWLALRELWGDDPDERYDGEWFR